MSPEAEEICETLDAAIFSGCEFQSPENLIELVGYLVRWQEWTEEQGRTPETK